MDCQSMSFKATLIDWQSIYPMDYYANDSLGSWTVNSEANRPLRQRRPRININTSSPTCHPTEDNHCCKKKTIQEDVTNTDGSLAT
uniref:Uncharacterized protein n=1 Tax=Arion vulgaris TaxID=1028688 RepID=A0A0B7A5D2_9EUPU